MAYGGWGFFLRHVWKTHLPMPENRANDLAYYQELAHKLADGIITPAEREELEQWYNQEQDNPVQIPVSFAATEDQHESRMLAKIKEKAEIESKPVRAKRIPLQKYQRWWAAAAVIIILFAGYQWFGKRQATPIAKVVSSKITQAIASSIQNIVLPDGSTVILHEGSRLDYPTSFDGSTREVSLSGEAYFDIMHNAAKPFIIHTGKLKTTVLGTAFNIKAYPGQQEITVSVTRGKVKVEDEVKLLAVLRQNEQISYNISQAKAVQQTVNAVAIVTDWTKRDMDFEAQNLYSIMSYLSRRYGVTISLKNETSAQCLVTASFSGTESLKDVLSAICTILSASYEIKPSGEIIINAKSCELIK